MTQPSPLAHPLPWNLVAASYAEEVVPQFEPYARRALALAGGAEGRRVLDVACGPGTLSFAAAETARFVDALDFSPEMIAKLEAKKRERGVTNVNARVGDGQALPYDDESFDVSASMFGLIFFPDRSKGLREMKRVLAPGGRAVISSWRPFTEAPLVEGLMTALAEQMPDLPFGKSKAPLGEPAEVEAELRDAGFADVTVEVFSTPFEAPDMATFWASMQRTMAPLVLLRQKLGDEAWGPLGERILGSLVTRFGDGPQRSPMPALLGVGVA